MTIRNIIGRLKLDKWSLAFIEADAETIIQEKKLVLHRMRYKGKRHWFADPFILEVTKAHIVCLVEEYSYDNPKGRIAKLVINRSNYRLESIKILLDMSTHASFPFIFRNGEDVYVIPENSQSGKNRIYYYNEDKDELTLLRTISKEPFTDATILNFEGKYYLMSTKQPYDNGPELNIYDFDVEKFLCSEKPIQVLSFKNNIGARNAGAPIVSKDGVFRPAQDCNCAYGKGIVIQKIKFCNGKFVIEPYCSFYPRRTVLDTGYHTFNSCSGLTVIDIHGYRYGLLGFCLEKMTPILKRLLNI